MPIYEYRCGACGKKSSFFIRSISASVEAVCAHCQSRDMERALSSFAHHRSLKTIHDEYGPPSGPSGSSLDYYNDPRNVGRHVEEAFQKHGVEMPDSVRENIAAARDGAVPEGLDL
jgi:putative FmdB family regulatory protein